MVDQFLEKRGRWLGGEFVLASGHKNSVLLHVVRIAVVARVAELPAEKWHHEHAVQGPAGRCVDGEIVRERVVTALVSQDPQAREEAALNEAVQRPGGHGESQWQVQLHEFDGGVEETGHSDQVASHVGEGADHGALEALRGNGVAEDFHVWDRGGCGSLHRGGGGCGRHDAYLLT